MIIDRDLSKYIISSEETISNTLKKIVTNKGRIICAVNDTGLLVGLFTNGDFLRWLINQDKIDLNHPVAEVLNRQFIFAGPEDGTEKIKSYLKKVLYVPVLDRHRRLVGVARERKGDGVVIGKFSIDADSPVFIIAEIGINHNGQVDLAKKLIDAAIASGADCAKFQLRDIKSLYANEGNPDDPKENLGSQYVLNLLARFQLSNDEMFSCFDYCREKGILPLCTPWDRESLRVLENYGMEAYKVASADLTNHDLLEAIADTGKPMIISTGMSTENEIRDTVGLLGRKGANYVLLHCNSTYPAPFKDVNLNYMDRLRQIGDSPVGYSGHERGFHVAIAAVARGAKIIEKHITLDKSMEGVDHKVSLLPDEFALMVTGIRQVEESLGSAAERGISQGERMNRSTLAKSLVVNRDIRPGEEITEEMIDVKGPGRGLQPSYKSRLIGLQAKREMKSGDFFYPSDLETEAVKAGQYHFRRPWGVPVRYYDFKTLLAKSNPDFLEFHLSFKDMDQDIGPFFDKPYDMGLVVHSPDFFPGDHLLNLCDLDKNHRNRSIEELQRVIDVTRRLKPFFKKAQRPLVVASVGGYTKGGHMRASEIPKMYDLIAESLSRIDSEGVEIIPQTLPPFPWYFGGQLYLSLFVNPDDTVEFCRKYGYRVCLDISHAKLACNHYRWSFKEYVEKLGPHIAHLHIADALGVDDEGLQIGDGDIDFPALAADLDRVAPAASFIPEIWQGHENEGEGFWIAQQRLQQWF